MEGRTVCGVKAQTDRGEEFYLGNSVLLCDGGFQANPELVARYITPAYKLRGIVSGTGDALQMGMAVGAKMINLEWFYGHILTRDPLRSDALVPEFGLGGLLRVGICVDGYGRRFADEALGDEVMADRIAKSSTPGGCWVVFDDGAWRSEAAAYGELLFNPNLVTRGGGTVLSALSAEELADQAGLPRSELSSTLEEFNAHMRHRSSITVPRTGSARPIDARPLHAIPAIAGITLAMGGLLINEFAQVLDKGESVINGLYAAGGSMGGLQGGPGFGYSGGLSEAAVFGLLAAEHIASARQALAASVKDQQPTA
jgi:fumarate reductase flavoprotein subunit